jgi:CxxC-x17-CxxC domain-containing protein
MTATEIVCAACGTEFSFSQEEQEFYESKGFQPPRKCKPCRDAAKQNRGGGGGYGGSRGGYGGGGGGSYGGSSYGRPQRQMYDAVCASCGINTQVPFQPNGTKPVYCRDCFQSSASY